MFGISIRAVFIVLSAMMHSCPAVAQDSLSAVEVENLGARCEVSNLNACDKLVQHFDSIARSGGSNTVNEAQAWTLKIDWAERGCELGSGYGCIAAGWAFENGEENRQQDLEKAYQFYSRGCTFGNRLSCSNLGGAFYFGIGVRQDQTQGLFHFEQACSQGFARGCERRNIAVSEMAMLDAHSSATDSDQFVSKGLTPDGLKSLENRCNESASDTCETLTKYFDALARAGGTASVSVDASWKLKIDWAEKGCKAGSKYACDASGWAYEHGAESREKDLVKAADYYYQGCQSGAPLSCNNYALALRHGRGRPKMEGPALDFFGKACDLGYQDACRFKVVKAKPVTRTTPEPVEQQPNIPDIPPDGDYSAMTDDDISLMCVDGRQIDACKELYLRVRGEDPRGFTVAEFICNTWGRPDYCFEAGADLLLGNGNTYPDEARAYTNFDNACYMRHAESCYQGGTLKMARGDFYDAMLLFDVACTNFGYRDSCALKRSAQRGGDRAVAEANRKQRENHDDALTCKKTRIIGNGGRTHMSYDCRTNLQWRLGKRN